MGGEEGRRDGRKGRARKDDGTTGSSHPPPAESHGEGRLEGVLQPLRHSDCRGHLKRIQFCILSLFMFLLLLPLLPRSR